MSSTITKIAESLPKAVRDNILGDADCASIFYHLLDTRAEAASSPASQPLAELNIAALKAAATADANTEKAVATTADWKLLYDVMRVRGGAVMLEEAHVQRITGGYASLTGQTLPAWAPGYIRSVLRHYCGEPRVRAPSALNSAATAARDLPEQNVKFLLWFSPTASSSKCNFVVYFVKTSYPPAALYERGADLALLFHAARTNPNVKVIQSTLRARANAAIAAAGVFEVLLVHGEEDKCLIPEGSRSNYLLFGTRSPASPSSSSSLRCSSKDTILVGVTLQAVERAAEHCGLGAIDYARLTLRDVLSARAVATLGTSPGVLPIRRLWLYYDAESKAAFLSAVHCVGLTAGDIDIRYEEGANAETATKAFIEYDPTDASVAKLREAYETLAVSQ